MRRREDTYTLGQFTQAVSSYYEQLFGRWPDVRTTLRWRTALGVERDTCNRFYPEDVEATKALINELKTCADAGIKPNLKTIAERISNAYQES